jgi:hemin uptake protein HemP
MNAPRPPADALPQPTASPAGVASIAAAAGGRPIASESLFAGATEVQILHRGSLYRLKQTALGKLILTK